MRVLFISDVYFPRVNGVSTSIATFRHDLAACNVTSTLVVPGYGAAAPGAPGEAPGELVRVASARVPGDPEDRRMRWGALTRVLASLAPERFDLVHVHTPFVAHYAGVRFARRAGIPCIATYHTFFEEYLHHYVPALPRPLGRYLARAFTRSQCRAVDALVVPSEPMRALLEQYGVATPMHVLPTGLPAECFRPADGTRFRARFGLPPERPILLYVGRVAHEKNIEFLIHTFVRVRAAVPAALLVIAGEGPAQRGLRALVARLGLAADVCFVGYLEREQALLDCYAAAHAFVFASRTETQGLVLLEAMAQGIPVVSTAELGTRSVLQPEAGALVVAEDAAAFAAAAIRVLEDEPLRERLAARSRAYARTWSAQEMARRLAALYGEVCARRAASSSGDSATQVARDPAGI